MNVTVKKGATNYEVALTHEQRRQLIDTPWTLQRVVPYPWAGVLIQDDERRTLVEKLTSVESFDYDAIVKLLEE